MTSEINVMQINKQRSRAAHLTALQAAHTEQQQVVCIQEPWIGPDITKEKTLSQPGYRIFTPQAHWTERPRAIIYVSSQLHSEQAYIVDEHPDMVNVTVQVENSLHDILNIQPPTGREPTRGSTQAHHQQHNRWLQNIDPWGPELPSFRLGLRCYRGIQGSRRIDGMDFRDEHHHPKRSEHRYTGEWHRTRPVLGDSRSPSRSAV